jgi:hypothetical protein
MSTARKVSEVMNERVPGHRKAGQNATKPPCETRISRGRQRDAVQVGEDHHDRRGQNARKHHVLSDQVVNLAYNDDAGEYYCEGGRRDGNGG